MNRAAAMAMWTLGVLTGCAGDVYTVDLRLADHLLCDQTPLALRSVEVDVVRETADALQEVDGLGSCEAVGPTNRVADLVTPFEAAGVYVAGAPADSRTILRFVGYTSDGCLRDTERVCGITCPPVRQGELPEGGVTANFVCEGRPLQNRAYLGCVNLESLDAEARAQVCASDP